MNSRPLVYLLDAHYQIFRAYHSLPDLRAPDGSPVGDATDNIPGVRGIGARTAKALLGQLEGLFGRLGINAMLERVPLWCD
jgi:5'-3' exonuclease